MMKDMTYMEAIRAALGKALAEDPSVFLLGEDIGAYGGAFGVTKGLIDKFGPERIRNTPISESTIIGLAIGSAMGGFRPVVEIMFMDFMTLAMDQIANHLAKMSHMFNGQIHLPVVIRTPAGGGRGYGPTHSQSLESWLMSIPGIKIAAPSTPHDANGLLRTAIRDDNPVIFIEHKLLYASQGPVPEQELRIDFGKAIVRKPGKHVSVVSFSHGAILSLQAAEELAAQNIDAEVIDLRTLNPLDMTTVAESVEKTGKVVLVEEGPRTGGVGGEIAAQIFETAFDYLDSPIKRVAAQDVPISCSQILEDATLPSVSTIVSAAKEVAYA